MLMQSCERAAATTSAWLYVDEIAHRTMNDYAFMLASIERASRAVSDPIAASALAGIKARLAATAGAYRALCPPSDDGPRRLDQDLERLCAALSHCGDENVSLTLVCEPVSMPAQRCWRACLIVSELVSNAAKHAFAACDAGEIVVDVRSLRGELRIVVTDNGIGSDIAVPGRGTRVVSALAQELGAVIWRKHTPSGSIIVVMCPLDEEVSLDRAELTPRFNRSHRDRSAHMSGRETLRDRGADETC